MYYLRRYDRSDTELSVTVVHVHVRVVLYTYVYSTKVSIISNFRISSSTIRVVLNKSTARILTVRSRFVCTSHRKSELNALCGRFRTIFFAESEGLNRDWRVRSTITTDRAYSRVSRAYSRVLARAAAPSPRLSTSNRARTFAPPTRADT